LKLTPDDVQGSSLAIQHPKSGRKTETVYVPRKILGRLTHDLRRHAATYASRSGTFIEIASKVILRHADLSTTQRYLGKVNDTEAIRWIETLYG